MFLINKNPEVLERNEGSLVLLVPGDIVIELDPFSSCVYSAVDKVETIDELVKIAQKAAEDFGFGNIEADDMRKDLEIFLLTMLAQGGLISEKKFITQPYRVVKDNEYYDLYFPYIRSVYKLTEELYKMVEKYTVSSYDEIVDLEEPEKSFVGLLNILSLPVALNDAMDFHHVASRRIVMLPTTACNLKCEYCYAWRDDKPINNMTCEMTEAGINYVVSNAIAGESPSVDISFMGGGEPTCNWNALVHSVEYAKNLAKENDLPFSSTLTTNGVLSEEKVDWIIENINFIKISFDGIKEIQNKQRPAKVGDSFSQAVRTMQKLSEAGSNFLVRITVTNDAIERLAESVEFLVDNFTPTSIIINPVYVCGSCASHGVSSIEYSTVCEIFDRIQNIGLEKHVDIVIPYDKVTYMDVPKLPFCGFQKGNCFLTPEGYVSACSEIDGRDDPRSTIFFFGSWDKEKAELVINEEKELQLHEISTASNDRCMSCSNQHFCPGPCLVRRINSETLATISKMREGKKLDSSFSEEEMEILLNSDHSEESIIQCNMTKILTDYQIKRIVNMHEDLNKLALECRAIDLQHLKNDGIISAVSIKCK